MFLDSKKRIFGIINILDFLVILIILIFVFGGIDRLNTFKNISSADLSNCEITIIATEISEGLSDEIQLGDKLYFSVSGSYFGTIKNVEILNHKELVTLEDGKIIFMEMPNIYDATIVINTKIKDDPDGIMISTNQVYIGQENRLKSRYYVFDSIIEDFNIEK